MVSPKFEVIGLCSCQILKLNEGLVYACNQKNKMKSDPLHNNMRSKFRALLVRIICYVHKSFNVDICDLADYIQNGKHHDFFYNPIILFVC